MIKKWTLFAAACAAASTCASPASALEGKRTVIVCGGPSDPVAIRARAELAGASFSVANPQAPADMSRTEVETLMRALGASGALVVQKDAVEVWITDDASHRALLVERVDDTELGALRGVEIVRASFAADAPAKAPSASPEHAPLTDESLARNADAPARWTVSASVGSAVLSMQAAGYGSGFVAPVEVGLQRALGHRLSLGVYGGGAPGLSVTSDGSKGIWQWRVGTSLQARFSDATLSGAWAGFSVGYSVVELENGRRGADGAVTGGYDFRTGERTSIGPFFSARGGLMEGDSFGLRGDTVTEGPILFASVALGARINFDGL